MYSKETSITAVLFITLATVAALASVYLVYYWLLGVTHCPDDWRGTVALGLTAVGARVAVGK